MSTSSDGPSETLRGRLADHETLQWRGKPHRPRTLLQGVRFVAPVLVALGMFGVVVWFFFALAVTAADGNLAGLNTLAVVVAGIAVLVVGGIGVVVGRRRYDLAEYAATEERLMAFGGIFGRDYSAVDWSDVRDLEVTVGALDGPFDTGRVQAVTEGSGGVTLRFVSRPYELTEELEAIRNGTGTQTSTGSSTTSSGTQAESSTPSESETPDRPRSQPVTDEKTVTSSELATTTESGGSSRDVSRSLRRLLRDGEELRWHYRPPPGTYLWQNVLGVVIAALVLWSIFYGMFVGLPVLTEFGPFVEAMLGVRPLVVVAGGWAVGLLFWCVVGGLAVYNGRDRVEFAATDQRALELGGMVGLDTSAVEWTNVQDVEVERHALTRVFGTGNVVVRTAGGRTVYRGGGLRFGPIEAPMEAAERIEAVYRGEATGEPILRGDDGGRSATTPTSVAVGDLSGQARRLVTDEESLVWRGIPAFVPFVVPALGGGLFAAVLGVVVLTVFHGSSFAFLAFLAAASGVGRRLLRYRNAEYVATDRRVLQFDGAVGRDASSVEWNDVQDVEVEVGPVDGYAGAGTLRFSRAGAPTRQERQQSTSDDSRDVFTGVQFRAVKNPWTVQEVLENARRE